MIGPEELDELIARIEAKVIEAAGGTFGARVHADDIALFSWGIEATIDESDGIPHALGPVTVGFEWHEILDLMDQGQSWWLLTDTILHSLYVVLGGDGLGDAMFGMAEDDVVAELGMWYGDPVTDTGWETPGICAGSTRLVTWRVATGVVLNAVFSDTDQVSYEEREPHFTAYWLLANDVGGLDRRIPLPATPEGVTVGSTIEEFEEAYGTLDLFTELALIAFLPDGQAVVFSDAVAGTPAYEILARAGACPVFD